MYPSFSLELSASSSELSLSSSSGTSHTPSGPLPHRRHQVSSYSTPSSSVRPSRKRCKSPTTSLLAALPSVSTNRLPPYKRFIERKIIYLPTRVRAAELSNESSRVLLGIARTGLAKLRDTAEQLQQSEALAAHKANWNNENGNGNESENGNGNCNETNRNAGGAVNCATNCQVKFATCTLTDGALTWWNSYVKTVGIDAAYEMSWKELMKMMTELYYPRNEIQKMENEL
ncbi:reverse transcriptase domain-containing protein [Tanacetum coccineum]